MFKCVKIRNYEIGLWFHDGEFRGLLRAGTDEFLGYHWFFDPFNKVRVDVVSQREPWLAHEKLDLIVKSGLLADLAVVLDLKDNERALVWIENRFCHVLRSGLYACWTSVKKVRAEVVDISPVRFEHAQFKSIVQTPLAKQALDICSINRDSAGVLFIDGRYIETLGPGEYAFWKGAGDARVVEVDLREALVDISGQDVITADKVTVRLNAVLAYKVVDPRLAISQTEDLRQTLYRDTQLVLRSVVGTRELESLLSDKDAVTREIEAGVARRSEELGLRIVSVGIRDVILPGEMKELLNKVIEARKAAEANLISRREETAAIRSQANTAKLLSDSPTLMRLRELETLEKIAANGKLRILLGDRSSGEKGLADKVLNLI